LQTKEYHYRTVSTAVLQLRIKDTHNSKLVYLT